MKYSSTVKEKLRSGKPVLSAMTRFKSPIFAEVMVKGGYDAVIIDCEHYPFDDDDIINIARAVHKVGGECYIRPSRKHFESYYRYLDMGLDGLYIANVETREEAQMAVDAAKYAPRGRRGCCPITRGADYGVRLDTAEYYRSINDRILVTIMIESKRGVENIDEILSVEGIDVVAVGPSDLSGSFGHPGVYSDDVKEATELVYSKAKARGIACEAMVHSAEDARKALERGDLFFFLDSDLQLVTRAFRRHNDEARAMIAREGVATTSNHIKERIRSFEPILLPYIRMPETAVAEIAVMTGSDLIVLDNEHFAYSDRDIVNMIRAVHARGGKVLLRLPDKNRAYIGRALDMGADGIVAPIIDSYEEALRVVRAATYGPVGERGFCPITAGNLFGYERNPREASAYANAHVIIAVMIESKSGVDDLDKILSIPEIDYISIGPSDISASYGYAGQVDHPEVKKIIQLIREKVKKAGKALCGQSYTTEAAQRCLEDGITIMNTGSELQYLIWEMASFVPEVKGLCQ